MKKETQEFSYLGMGDEMGDGFRGQSCPQAPVI